MQEPIARAHILVPQTYVGSVMNLAIDRRGVQVSMEYIGRQVSLTYDLPMNEIVLDFFDKLKSITRGFASLDYHFQRYETANMVKMDVLINGDIVDALAVIVHKNRAQSRGRILVEKMREIIPRQMFDIAIQAALGNQIIARQTVKALRKNVTAKCYGGDVSRKKKIIRKTKTWQKTYETNWSRGHPSRSFFGSLPY